MRKVITHELRTCVSRETKDKIGERMNALLHNHDFCEKYVQILKSSEGPVFHIDAPSQLFLNKPYADELHRYLLNYYTAKSINSKAEKEKDFWEHIGRLSEEYISFMRGYSRELMRKNKFEVCKDILTLSIDSGKTEIIKTEEFIEKQADDDKELNGIYGILRGREFVKVDEPQRANTQKNKTREFEAPVMG